MHGFDNYLDLVFDGFDLYIVTLVKTESELILKIYDVLHQLNIRFSDWSKLLSIDI